ncbi:MAG: septum formation family protein [Salinibacterium sp.]|nr:septum formation family protein [Salinibacterium sp.]
MTIISDTTITRLLAIATLGIASFALAGCSLLPGGNANSSSGSGTTTGDEASDVFSIRIGDCLNDGDASGEVSTVPIVSCDEPHDSEAYDSGNLDDGSFPGDDAVKQAAEQLCGPSFTAFIGLSYDESAYDYSYYFPTENSWSAGDREVMCVAYADDLSKVTGTLQNINK